MTTTTRPYVRRHPHPCEMVAKSSELRTGDIVSTHGMHVLLDGPVKLSTSHPEDIGPVFWSSGLVLNEAEAVESLPMLRGLIRDGRWSIQGNDRVSWWVLRAGGAGPVHPTTAEVDEHLNRYGAPVDPDAELPAAVGRDVLPYLATIKDRTDPTVSRYIDARRFPSWEALNDWTARTLAELRAAGYAIHYGPLCWHAYPDEVAARLDDRPALTLYHYTA